MFFQKLSCEPLVTNSRVLTTEERQVNGLGGPNATHRSLASEGPSALQERGPLCQQHPLLAFLCLGVISVFAGKPEIASLLQRVHVFVGVLRERGGEW